MITYLYWSLVFILAIAPLIWLGKQDHWKTGIGICVCILMAGWAAYFFHFEQIFVKRYGGVMTIEVPDGQVHLGATWKDEHLWINNYDPATNTCHFSEYSKGNILQGRVHIKNCNPLLPSTMPNQ